MAAKTTAAKAREAEAAEETTAVTFTHDGATYELLPESIDNLELFEAIEDEMYITAIRGFIGREAWAQFKDKYRTEDGRVPMASLEGFLDAVMGALGSGN